jgi:hypothetical protein
MLISGTPPKTRGASGRKGRVESDFRADHSAQRPPGFWFPAISVSSLEEQKFLICLALLSFLQKSHFRFSVSFKESLSCESFFAALRFSVSFKRDTFLFNLLYFFIFLTKVFLLPCASQFPSKRDTFLFNLLYFFIF